MKQEENDERAMFPRHVRTFLTKSYKERLLIANKRYNHRKALENEKQPTVDELKKADEPLDNELLNFFATLHENQVQYMLVGGFAVNMHCFSHYTDDIDLWIDDAIDNLIRLDKTFLECGMNPNLPQLTFGLPIKTTTKMPLSFEDCFRTAVIAMVDDISIPVLAIDEMIICEITLPSPMGNIYQGILEELKKIVRPDNS